MKQINIIEVAKGNNGYLYEEIIKKNNINSSMIKRLIQKGIFRKVHRGIYILNDFIEDPFYIYSLIYKNLVFSNETAIYLNKLSNRGFPGYDATFPRDSYVPKKEGITTHKKKMCDYELGITNLVTEFGNTVKCYDKERCICDLFINEDEFDYEDRIYAINKYKDESLNLKKLYEYGIKLKIIDKIRNVFEVVAWK